MSFEKFYEVLGVHELLAVSEMTPRIIIANVQTIHVTLILRPHKFQLLLVDYSRRLLAIQKQYYLEERRM